MFRNSLVLSVAALIVLATAVDAKQPPQPVAIPSADMRIVVGLHPNEKSVLVVKHYIDASSKPVGEYLKEVTVGKGSMGKGPMKLYITPAGLALLEKYNNEDKLGAADVSFAVDPSPLSDWWNGIIEEGKGKLQ
jgi:hypothetical protein